MSRTLVYWSWRTLFCLATGLSPVRVSAANDGLSFCLDGFCIGQSIASARFGQIAWLTPRENVQKEPCRGVGCQPGVAFPGYTLEDQARLADAVNLTFTTSWRYTIVTAGTLGILRKYKYECNQSAGSLSGERRFLAIYQSTPSNYLTVIGLRLIGNELRVYRIVRQFPIHNQGELQQLAGALGSVYGNRISYVNYLSSNAYSEVIARSTEGWFGRSQLFNPSDMSDNAAELVLIDRQTRALLQPTSMPDSGEIKPIQPRLPEQCSRSMPIQ